MRLQHGVSLFFKTALCLSAALLWAATASAGLIVKDTWSDGERNTIPPNRPIRKMEPIPISDGDIESAWFRAERAHSIRLRLADHFVGQATLEASASWTTYFTPEASPVTLASFGNQLKVTWVFSRLAT